MMSFDTEARTQAVLTLYTETLADVQFPDVDCAVLTAAAAEVAAARETLANAEAALDSARGELNQTDRAPATGQPGPGLRAYLRGSQ